MVAKSFDNNSAQSQAALLGIWRKLRLTLEIPKPSPLTLKQARARWWWTRSVEDFRLFTSDSDAQGYELLRRLPQHRQQLFFNNRSEKTWCQLCGDWQELFISQYRRVLAKMGLAKQIRFSPSGVEFDCRLPSTHLIKALKLELCRPKPLIVGTYGRNLVPKPVSVDELPVTAYTKQTKGWKVAFAPKPWTIHLPFPEGKFTGDQYLSYFATFVKDRVPRDFAKHRAKCRRKFGLKNPKRQPFNKPEIFALALMVFDYGDISKLVHWLLTSPSVLTSLGIIGTEKQIAKRLYNARRSLEKLAS